MAVAAPTAPEDTREEVPRGQPSLATLLFNVNYNQLGAAVELYEHLSRPVPIAAEKTPPANNQAERIRSLLQTALWLSPEDVESFSAACPAFSEAQMQWLRDMCQVLGTGKMTQELWDLIDRGADA